MSTWRPDGTQIRYKPPRPGDLVGYDHAVWRVIEVNPLPEDRWSEKDRYNVRITRKEQRFLELVVPCVVVIRPARITSVDVWARDHDLHLKHQADVRWHMYPHEHYAVCAQCGDPLPCREILGMRAGEAALARMARYEVPGVCPGCEKPVTQRQKSITFDENVEIPGGPPVTFHLRRDCHHSAVNYERRWAAASPGRRTRLSCSGSVVAHSDGSYECSQFDLCPGPEAIHGSYRTCACTECHASGSFDCHPAPTARRRSETDLFGEAS